MTDQAGPSNQRKPTLAQGTARPEDGGRDAGRLRPNAPKAPTATIKLCKCFESGTGRNLIVCIDGTSNQFGINNTNVVELYSLIKAQDDEGREQLTFYNSGIGTYAEPSWKSLSYIMQVIYHKIDMAIAWNFERIIIAAYLWLAEQYQPGDRIYLFGFSRGAYQVRALAAMIDKVGLIKKGNQEQIPFAYQLYAACGEEKKPSQWSIWGTLSKLVPSVFKSSKPKPSAEQMAKHFREVFSRVVNIHFIGAWDTVSSVGTVRDKSLPGTTDGMHQACYFRHAMALDERRVKFLPEYAYGGTSLSAAEQGEQPSADVAQRPADAPNTIDETAEAVTSAVDVEATGEVIPAGKTTGKTTDETASATNRYIHTKEVWFAGTHSDIGGGNVENPDMDRARPPLRWMCFEAAAAGLRLHPIQRELKPGEKNEVRESLTWVWWLLELLPLKRLSYERTGTDSTRRPHCGAGRIIQKGQKIHCSLIPDQNSEQGDNVNTTYVPKACPPGEDREKFWESLRKNTTPDQSKVEYDWYDSVHRIVEDYKNPNGDADAKRKHLREIYDMAQSGEGQLALREAKVADVIQLPEAEGAQWGVS
ncbi:hypothetical protein OF83DRAFT_1287291 [Amylostereum chailletii]|nr:hypothetical protein OF83DRAFT_1287291 [Amylostereum chailletii]